MVGLSFGPSPAIGEDEELLLLLLGELRQASRYLHLHMYICTQTTQCPPSHLPHYSTRIHKHMYQAKTYHQNPTFYLLIVPAPSNASPSPAPARSRLGTSTPSLPPSSPCPTASVY